MMNSRAQSKTPHFPTCRLIMTCPKIAAWLQCRSTGMKQQTDINIIIIIIIIIIIYIFITNKNIILSFLIEMNCE